MGFCQCCGEYPTTRVLVIKSKGVAMVFRFIQIILVGYVFGYVCMYKKVYQATDSVISSVATKVKGVTMTNTSKLGVRVWDVADFIIPPQEDNSFFVMTNMIITANQIQTQCPELPSTSSTCSTDDDCAKGYSHVRSNGVQTGKCVNFSDTVKTCEVLAWCPLEDDSEVPKPALLADAEDFTVLIKNNIQFPKFHFSKRNILPHITSSYLKNCTFNRITAPNCPIFYLRDIFREAKEDFAAMAVHGGIMSIMIHWDCNLDMPEKMCLPNYIFRRLDNKNPENNVSPGYNFRFANYFHEEGQKKRTLIKAFGIRFDVVVFGKAGKFSVVSAVVNLGGAFVILALAPAVCDWFILTCMKKKEMYKKYKFTHMEELDETLSELAERTTYGTQ